MEEAEQNQKPTLDALPVGNLVLVVVPGTTQGRNPAGFRLSLWAVGTTCGAARLTDLCESAFL